MSSRPGSPDNSSETRTHCCADLTCYQFALVSIYNLNLSDQQDDTELVYLLLVVEESLFMRRAVDSLSGLAEACAAIKWQSKIQPLQ